MNIKPNPQDRPGPAGTAAPALRRRLAAAMAHGHYHAGEDLCAALGINARQLWDALVALAAAGLDFEAAAGHGYRLYRPVELLDEGRIRAALTPSARAALTAMEVLDEVDSTNRRLLDGARAGLGPGIVCLAECQTAGRGRRGRRWVSPYAANLYLSLLWELPGAADPAALGLACAIAVARAAGRAGVAAIGLKWPNDVIWQGAKLGGLLLESVPRGGGHAVVMGVGLNVLMPPAEWGGIGQPGTDLQTAAGGPVSRNAAAAWLLEELVAAVRRFQADGLAPFVEQWRQYDIMRGKPAVLRWPGGHVMGVVEGIDAGGDLVMSVSGVTRRYRYGEVSLRAAP